MSDSEVAHDLHAQILLVDDEVDHAEVMAEALRRVGHVCTIVDGAKAAEEELRFGNFDVIVTDLCMEEETSGLDVLAMMCLAGVPSAGRGLDVLSRQCSPGKQRHQSAPSNTLT